jgi:hypothetical protein
VEANLNEILDWIRFNGKKYIEQTSGPAHNLWVNSSATAKDILDAVIELVLAGEDVTCPVN